MHMKEHMLHAYVRLKTASKSIFIELLYKLLYHYVRMNAIKYDNRLTFYEKSLSFILGICLMYKNGHPNLLIRQLISRCQCFSSKKSVH